MDVESGQLGWITGSIWNVADDLQGDVYVRRKSISIHLFGQEINPQTYAITKGNLVSKGEGAAADNMRFGTTLSSETFPANEFDFKPSNPPYGKSWETDLKRLGGKGGITDARFREYRLRLIPDVATCKADVRGLAPAKPPTAEGSAEDELAESNDGDEAADEPGLIEEAADVDD